jgi:hypothetical protein
MNIFSKRLLKNQEDKYITFKISGNSLENQNKKILTPIIKYCFN